MYPFSVVIGWSHLHPPHPELGQTTGFLSLEIAESRNRKNVVFLNFVSQYASVISMSNNNTFDRLWEIFKMTLMYTYILAWLRVK